MFRRAQYCSRKVLAANRRGLAIDAAIAWKIGTFLSCTVTGVATYVSYCHYSYYSPENYDAVAEAIKEILVQPDYPDGHIGPLIIRLVFNSCATFDLGDGSGGINGATMRFKEENECKFNKGLEVAFAYLEPIKAEFPWISYSDLWVLASYVALEDLGGPQIEFQGGRVDATEPTVWVATERLFKTDWGPTGMRKVFHRMGFNDREIVVLMHGHTLGKAHLEYSGYCGQWTSDPLNFDVEYSKELFYNEWALYRQYGTKQFIDLTQTRMMLSTDYCMTIDATFRRWLEHYAENEEKLRRDFGIAWKKATEQGCFPQKTIKGLPPHDDEASSEETFQWLIDLEEKEAERLQEKEARRLAKRAQLEARYGKSQRTEA